ncbi:MAG: hypothetical protein RR922_00175 [Clostridia bacterium]
MDDKMQNDNYYLKYINKDSFNQTNEPKDKDVLYSFGPIRIYNDKISYNTFTITYKTLLVILIMMFVIIDRY